MFEIKSGKIAKAQKIVIYGVEGIGKTTFASNFPDPIFIDTEGSTNNIDVKRLPTPTSWQMLLQEVNFIKNNPSCKTLIIDTIDWAEQMAVEHICSIKQIKGIEDINYGKGYVYVAEEFGRLLNLLSDVVDKGVNVVLTAHCQIKKFELPDELGSFDRWELKLQKRTASLVKEWSDLLLFANYKTIVSNIDNQGAGKGKNKAQGNRRVLYTSHNACYDAKNRHNLASELDFNFENIKHIFNTQVTPASNLKTKETTVRKDPIQCSIMQESINIETNESDSIENNDIPKSVLDLMKASGIAEEEIRQVVFERGYNTLNTPVSKYDPAFINGWVIPHWEKIVDKVKENRSKELPFY